MLDPKKGMILAAAALIAPLPSKEKVQALKYRPKPVHTFREVLTFLLDGEPSLPMIEQAHDLCKKFRKLEDKEFAKKHTALSELWNGGTALPVHSGGTQGHTVQLSDIKGKPARLAEYNLLLKKKGLDPVKSFNGTLKQLEERIDKLKKSILKDSIKPFKQYPTAVAEGAYRSDEEARSKTGHSVTGRKAQDDKRQAVKDKFIAKRSQTSAGVKADASTPARDKTLLAGDFVSLSDIAKLCGIDPKAARRKARLHARDIAKLEAGKYKFSKANVAKVKAIIQSDGRKA